MFGVGIFEVLVIIIVAIIALGPNKLPQTIVDIVKFFRAVKKTLAEAKDTFDKEIQLSEIKQEALKYKESITNEVNKITQDIKLDELREIRTDSITKPFEDALNETKSSLQSTLNGAIDSLNAPLDQSSITKPQTSESSSTQSLDSEKFAPLSYASTPSHTSESSPAHNPPHNPPCSPIHQMAQEQIMRDAPQVPQKEVPQSNVLNNAPQEGANAPTTPHDTATKG